HEVFDRTMHARAVVLIQLESDLRQALERSQFVPYYMPIVSLETGRISGFEALVRWNHPERGIVPPVEFIGIAEESGLVVPIDRLIMRKAAQQLKAWQDKYEMPDLTVSVNLSGRQFRHTDLAEQVERSLKDSGLDGRSLAVEITENVLIQETETATQMLGNIRKLGVRTYLDDFGTGYSSLSYLHRFPIDTVKIDRSFVSRMGPKKEDHEIVRAIVQLAQNLGIGVVAEGVESPSHLSLLRALKCGYGQGWFFSKPIPAEEAEKFLAEEPRW
ncbi:MAG TPA: EAL domain-containing protein, partial [Planctomycetota bacterium]|nr:EAL domain-containing protein [Planctomycetota bacterium]